jgi:hypothetical protein
VRVRTTSAAANGGATVGGLMTKNQEPADTYELVPLGSPAGTYNLTELRKSRKRSSAIRHR